MNRSEGFSEPASIHELLDQMQRAANSPVDNRRAIVNSTPDTYFEAETKYEIYRQYCIHHRIGLEDIFRLENEVFSSVDIFMSNGTGSLNRMLDVVEPFINIFRGSSILYKSGVKQHLRVSKGVVEYLEELCLKHREVLANIDMDDLENVSGLFEESAYLPVIMDTYNSSRSYISTGLSAWGYFRREIKSYQLTITKLQEFDDMSLEDIYWRFSYSEEDLQHVCNLLLSFGSPSFSQACESLCALTLTSRTVRAYLYVVYGVMNSCNSDELLGRWEEVINEILVNAKP